MRLGFFIEPLANAKGDNAIPNVRF